MKVLYIFLFAVTAISAQTKQKIYDIINSVSEERLRQDVKTLTVFGARNTFSDTLSTTRGFGATRRCIKNEYEIIFKNCNNSLNVFYQKYFVTKKGNRRVSHDAWVVHVVTLQKGTKYPNRYIIMSGDIDSRASETMDFITDAPGANDNASGMTGAIEAARVLSKYKFESSIIYVGLSGEKQGLFGRAGLAKYAKDSGWKIIGILNNDMIGNIEGVDGVITKSINFEDLTIAMGKTWKYAEEIKYTLKAIKENNILKIYVDENVLNFMENKEFESTIMSNETIEGTVMFIDICRFTAISESTTIDKAVKMITAYFNEMVKEIMAHEGHIDQFIGDAIMAVFKGDFRQSC
jgi:hypothetical protein